MAESKDPKGTCCLPKPNGDFCFSAFPAVFKISISKPTGGIFFPSCYSVRKLHKQRERALIQGSEEILKQTNKQTNEIQLVIRSLQ